MKKLMTLCLAAFALALGTNNVLAAPAEATAVAKKPAVAAKKKPVTAAKKKPVATKKKSAVAAPAVTSLVVLEAMWSAGGQEYKDAVIAASDRYKQVMDKDCKTKVPFNVASLVDVYHVYTPAGLESVRDGWIRKQVGTLACITMNRDGEQRAEKNLTM